MNNVSVAFNNRIEASDAARELGCAYSTVVALLSKKKLKGQKINRRWFVDFDDLQRAKATHLIKTRVSKLKRERMRLDASVQQKAQPRESETSNNKAELRFYVDKDKVNLLQMVLQSVDRNLSDYVYEKIEDLYEKIHKSLKNIKAG